MEPGKPNTGIKLTNDLIAAGIVAREEGDRIQYGTADPAIFTRQGGPSIAEQMMVKGCSWMRADNSRLPGWQALRERLGADRPMIYFLESCEHARRTLPVLQHDSKKFEDVDTEGEDHAADEVRYACMSRPWVKDGTQPPPPGPLIVTPKILTFNEAMKKSRSGRVARMERDL
jgi:hypothetical protein